MESFATHIDSHDDRIGFLVWISRSPQMILVHEHRRFTSSCVTCPAIWECINGCAGVISSDQTWIRRWRDNRGAHLQCGSGHETGSTIRVRIVNNTCITSGRMSDIKSTAMIHRWFGNLHDYGCLFSGFIQWQRPWFLERLQWMNQIRHWMPHTTGFDAACIHERVGRISLIHVNRFRCQRTWDGVQQSLWTEDRWRSTPRSFNDITIFSLSQLMLMRMLMTMLMVW